MLVNINIKSRSCQDSEGKKSKSSKTRCITRGFITSDVTFRRLTRGLVMSDVYRRGLRCITRGFSTSERTLRGLA